MDRDLSKAVAVVPRGGTVRLQGRVGQRLECLGGTLWITQDGDPRDVVIGAGEAFDLDRNGRVLASALGGPGRGDGRYLLLDAKAPATAAAA